MLLNELMKALLITTSYFIPWYNQTYTYQICAEMQG